MMPLLCLCWDEISFQRSINKKKYITKHVHVHGKSKSKQKSKYVHVHGKSKSKKKSKYVHVHGKRKVKKYYI